MDKAIIFIVEGPTDKKALESIFKKIYRNKEIHFEFTHGDITSNNEINDKNVENEIYKFVDDYRKDQKLRIKDIWQIVQIFDMDGAYIDDSNIVADDSEGFQYSLDGIRCRNVSKVINRNKHKRELMDYLLTLNDIKGIPYRCFYLSSNLDHALYNKMNLSEDEKIKYSNAFYETFIGKEDKFIKFLELEVVNGVPESYPSSWRYIKEGLNSLNRHTNLNIYFKENPII